MSPTRLPQLNARVAVTVTALAMLLAACGGTTTPSPTTQATPTVAPIPTPLDVRAEFIRIAADPEFSARATITGTATFGDVEGNVEGTLRGSGDDSAQSLTIGFAGASQPIESVSKGDASWTKEGIGPWLADEEADSSGEGSLTEWLRTLADLENLGVETRDGRQLVHLRPEGGAPVPPEALGFDAATITDPEVTIDFFVADDGTPVTFVIDARWVAEIEGQQVPIELTLDYELEDVGQPITITRPTDIWTRTSNDDLGYTMARPDGWEIQASADGDTFLLDGVDWVHVVPEPDAVGLSLDEFQSALSATYTDEFGAGPESIATSTLGGEPARFLRFSLTAGDGSPLVFRDMIAIHDDVGWEVSMIASGGSTLSDDDALFDMFTASFGFTP
jgi:hypothetical protein